MPVQWRGPRGSCAGSALSSELLISGLRALLNHSGNSFESPWVTENLSNRLVCSAEEIEVVPSTLVLSLIRRKVPRHKHYYRSSHMAPPQSITRLASFVRTSNGPTFAASGLSSSTPTTTHSPFACSPRNSVARARARRHRSFAPSGSRKIVCCAASRSIAEKGSAASTNGAKATAR